MSVKTEAEGSLLITMKHFKHLGTPTVGTEIVTAAIARLIETMSVEYDVMLNHADGLREIRAARDRLVDRHHIEAEDGDRRLWRLLIRE
jgi:hypothetical protein